MQEADNKKGKGRPRKPRPTIQEVKDLKTKGKSPPEIAAALGTKLGVVYEIMRTIDQMSGPEGIT